MLDGEIEVLRGLLVCLRFWIELVLWLCKFWWGCGGFDFEVYAIREG